MNCLQVTSSTDVIADILFHGKSLVKFCFLYVFLKKAPCLTRELGFVNKTLITHWEKEKGGAIPECDTMGAILC